MLGSGVEAEDVVQDAYRDMERSVKPIVLRPWLYTIARHRCISLLRARREHPVEDVHRARQLESRGGRRRARPAARAADDIARVVGCPQQKVKALVFQARSNLAAARAARDTPCREIREHIAVPDGPGAGRALIRRHVAVCDGCREFRDQVRAQRRGFALLLAVAPSLGLQGAVLGAIGGAGERVPLRLERTIHQTDHQLDIEAATTVDQRLLGMAWSPLGMTTTPATLTVHARLRPES
jgi:hypothetical protein